MALFVYEFLYRGHGPESIEEPAWHVILGEVMTDAFGSQTLALSSALTPAQANEYGFTLDTIIQGINESVMRLADRRTADIEWRDEVIRKLEEERRARVEGS